MARHNKIGNCVTCQRYTHLTQHHLIPRKLHRRAHFKKNYNKQQLAEVITICRQCHNAIHREYSEIILAHELFSAELLMANEKLSNHFRWVGRQRCKV